jgi:FkbM family methyltransferase
MTTGTGKSIGRSRHNECGNDAAGGAAVLNSATGATPEAVPFGYRLAGRLSRTGLRGFDRLAGYVLRFTRTPQGLVEGTFYRGVRFCVRPSEDGSLRALLVLAGGAPSLAAVFEAALRPGDIVVDVGANVGVYAAVAARLVGPEGSVLAFEPLPFPREALLELIHRNGFTQVRVLPFAVGASEGSMELHVTAGASGLTSAYARDNASVPVEVERTTLDAVVEKSGGPPPKLLKIDVEGFEFEVIKGAARLLTTENAPLVLFESNPELLASSQGTFADLQKWLAVRGYDLFGLTPSGLRAVVANAPYPLSQNTLAARPTAHADVLERLAHARFRRNQSC